MYKFGDMSNDTSHAMYMATFDKNFTLKRTEYKDIIVSYIAYRPVDAANVANMSVKVLEETFRHYYTSMKEGMAKSISDKVKQLDSSITTLTDTLAGMRDKYGIYGIISPARQNVTNGDIKGGGKGFGMGVEEIQNVESIKDQLVSDRAHYISLLNEFSAASGSSMEYLKLITRAVPPTGPTGAGLQMVLLVAGCLGLFFSIIYVLMMDYFRRLKAMLK
jgi:hypothetical protein